MVNTVSITRIRTFGILVSFWLGFGLMLTDSFSQQIGLFYHKDYIQIDEGNIFAEGSNMNASIDMLGYDTNLINEFSSSNIIESDLIIIPELERKNLYLDLNSDQKEDLKNFVNNGGGLIISGVVAPNEANAKNATDLLNGVFDFSLKTSEVALTGHSLKDVEGNQFGFAGSPDKIPNNNSIAFITSGLPSSSVSIYSDSNNSDHSSVSIIEFGKGKIIYLGWGWWNALPNGTQDGGWLSILEAAINIASCPQPEINAIGQKPTFNLDANKEVSIDQLSLPLLINACTDEYHITLSKSLFNCDDLGDNELTITLKDKIGRIATEKIIIEIKDQYDFCRSAPSFINLQGSIATPRGEPIGAVKINLSGENSFNTNTDIHGRFQISDVPTEDRYSLETIKDTKHLNGVSTFDLVMLSKYVNGLVDFTTPYQYIAADVNNSGSITVKDVLELRNLILYQTTRFENHNSWQIINNAIDLSDPLSAEVDKSLIFEAGSILPRLDYTGVKIGDINVSANPQRRNKDKTKIVIEDIFLKKGETIRIPIVLNSEFKIEGFQFGFSLNMKDIQLLDISSNIQNFDRSNSNTTDNDVLISWVNLNGQPTENSIELYMDMKVKNDTYLSNSISMISDDLTPELYDADLNINDLEVEFVMPTKQVEQQIDLKEQIYNYPNPFTEFTDIYFDLDQKAKVSIEIHSAEGKLVFSKTSTFEKGNQKIRIDDTQVNNPGLYYYSIIRGDIQKTTNTLIKF